MRENRLAPLGMTMVILALTVATAPAFLFEDGSFETMPAFADGEGWEAFGEPNGFAAVGWPDWANGAPGTNGAYADPGDGQHGLAFQTFAATNGGFYHDAPVAPGQEYIFHIQSHVGSFFYQEIVAPGSGTVSIAFDWYDADPDFGGSRVDSNVNDITTEITDGGSEASFPPGTTDPFKWQDWDYTNSAPGGAAYLRTTVQWTTDPPRQVNNTNNIDEAVRWDNAELTTALDPLNGATQTEAVLEISYETLTSTLYTNEVTADLQTWVDPGLPLVTGNDATQRVYVLPDPTVQAYRLSGATVASPGTIYSDANDGMLEARGDTATDLPPVAPWPTVHPDTFGNWQQTVGEWFGKGPDGPSAYGLTTIVLPFQLPNLGAVVDPFTSVDFGVMLNPQTPTNNATDIDLYAVRVDASPLISTNDWYNGVNADTNATLIQASFLTPASPSGWDNAPNNFTDAAGDATLLNYMNTAYAGGAGANEYVFLRLSYGSDTFATTNLPADNYNINVREAGSQGEWPVINYTATAVPLTGVSMLEPAFVDATVLEWDSQLGVQYQWEYSDDSGTTWLLLDRKQGDGAVLRVTDPEGPVSGRIYRVIVQPDVARVPGP